MQFFSLKITTIPFSEADSSKSKTQTIIDYLKDVEQNENTYKKSPINVSDIFIHEEGATIETWLLNNVVIIIKNIGHYYFH